MTGFAVGNIDTLIDRASTTGPDDLDHYCCCDEKPGTVTAMLCGHIEEATEGMVDSVSCPLCMLADEQDQCPKYGTCRYERDAS